MQRACFVLVGGFLSGIFLLAALFVSSASAGMSQDLTRCTAAQNVAAASACTRIMNSGRLPDAQMYIGYFNRGTAWRRAGEADKAIADFSKVLQLKPGFARAFAARASAKADLRDTAAALADLDDAVKHGGGDWRFLYHRAVIYRSTGDRDAALRDLNAALDVNPDAGLATLLRAMIRAEQGDTTHARAHINAVLAKGRDDALAHYARADVAFREGRTDASEADVDRALVLQKDFAAALALKGRIYEKRGDMASARVSYEKALASSRDGFDARVMRRLAGQRLASLDGAQAPDRNSKLAQAKLDTRPLDCKVFLPATGSVVTAKCSE